MRRALNKQVVKLPKPMYNIGALMDIPTGHFIPGPKGEMILNGGLAGVEGIIGLGNNFKSKIMHHMMLTAADRMACSLDDKDLLVLSTYDTEDNMAYNISNYDHLVNKNTKCIPRDAASIGYWDIISKAEMPAEKWVADILYPFSEAKEKDKKYDTEYECFMNPVTKDRLKYKIPTFIEIDSLTEFEPSLTIEAIKTDKLSDTNMIAMQQGRYKSLIVKDMPRLSNALNINFLLTSHLGKKIDVGGNPFSKPTKDLQYLKQDEKLKGTSDKALFLTTHLWKAYGSKALINPNTKQPEFPLYENDVETDLNIVNLQQLRNKSGPSGYVLELVVTQRDGVQPTLTEFWYLKNNKFGISGNPRSYWVDFYPDVKLSRTTIRKKIDEDYKLRRAINLLAEIRQMMTFMPEYTKYYMEPTALYERIKELGYDWNDILETRGWWTIKQYKKELRDYLSSLDLLRMTAGDYIPYWLDKDRKKLVKENIKKILNKEYKEK